MNTVAHTMEGTVTALEGRWYVIECPTAPPHLRTLNLTVRQVRGAKVGDRVRLTYQTTPSWGLWNVTEVLS